MDTSGNVVFDYEVTGAAASSIDTGAILNGDVDGWYTVIIRAIGCTSNLNMTFNNDAGANYGFLGIRAQNTAVASISNTAQAGVAVAYASNLAYTSMSINTIYAKAGAVRIVNTYLIMDINGTTVTYLDVKGNVWSNTADNITSLKIACASAVISAGTRIIILKGNALAVGVSPGTTGAWKRVGSSVLGGAASSVTFSGLNGDTAVCYYISHQTKASGAMGYVKFTVNADGGTNYGLQQLEAAGASAPYASRATGQRYTPAGYAGTNNYYTNGHILMFAKQGFVRPIIWQAGMDITGTTVTYLGVQGQVYSVTNTEITSATLSAEANNFAAGSQFDCYALYT
jgi:hypothetical protein